MIYQENCKNEMSFVPLVTKRKKKERTQSIVNLSLFHYFRHIFEFITHIPSKPVHFFIKMEKYYDIEPREKRAEIGFFLCVFAFSFIIISILWIFFPEYLPFMPSIYWFAAIPTFFFSCIFWIPLFIALLNCIKHPK